MSIKIMQEKSKDFIDDVSPIDALVESAYINDAYYFDILKDSIFLWLSHSIPSWVTTRTVLHVRKLPVLIFKILKSVDK